MESQRYIKVNWPESQELIEHERFDECVLVNNEDQVSQDYLVPQNLYDEIFSSK